MLAAHEFFVGPLASAPGLTLVLRRHEREASFLVSAAADIPTAIFLDGDFRFTCMPSVDNTSWNGIVVPNITIEVDETSILDAKRGQPPFVVPIFMTMRLYRVLRFNLPKVLLVQLQRSLPTVWASEWHTA